MSWLSQRPSERFELPGIEVVVIHNLKLVLIHDSDPGMDEHRYDALEAYLNKLHYFVFIVGVVNASSPTELPQ